MNAYVDASVLLRVVQGNRETLPTWSEIDPVSSSLIRTECLRVIDRARARGATDDARAATDRAAVLELLDSFTLMPVTDSILERAADPFPTALGTLDAIHLASAIAFRADQPGVAFATHDTELAIAAQSVGFDVLGA